MKIEPCKPDVIRLSNMAFFGYHGPRSIEREIGQQYMADVELHLMRTKIPSEDDISKTVDYIEIFDIAREIIENQSFKLIETIAEKIAGAILEKYDIISVDVSVRKLKPAIQGVMDYAEIKISRKRVE